MQNTGIFVINLDRSPERLRTFTANLAAFGLDFHRVAAVDGLQLDLSDCVQPEVDLKAWAKFHHREPKFNEIACYLSHIRALQAFIDSDYKYGVIFEDDALIDQSFPQVLRSLETVDDWDIVKLFATHPGVQIKRQSLTSTHYLTSFITQSGSAACYLIRREAAQKLIRFLRPARMPYDHVFDRNFAHGLKLRSIYPSLARRMDVPSTIGYDHDKGVKGGARDAKFVLPSSWGDRPLQRRWRVPFYRLSIEIFRITHNLMLDGGLRKIMQNGLARGRE